MTGDRERLAEAARVAREAGHESVCLYCLRGVDRDGNGEHAPDCARPNPRGVLVRAEWNGQEGECYFAELFRHNVYGWLTLYVGEAQEFAVSVDGPAADLRRVLSALVSALPESPERGSCG